MTDKELLTRLSNALEAAEGLAEAVCQDVPLDSKLDKKARSFIARGKNLRYDLQTHEITQLVEATVKRFGPHHQRTT